MDADSSRTDDIQPGPVYRTRTAAFLLALLGASLWFVFPRNRSPWAPDEARYVEVAREMDEAGSWLIPRLNGEIIRRSHRFLDNLARRAAIRRLRRDGGAIPTAHTGLAVRFSPGGWA